MRYNKTDNLVRKREFDEIQFKQTFRALQHTTWKAYSHPHGDETILVICSNTFNSKIMIGSFFPKPE